MPSLALSPSLRPCITELLRTCVHPDSLLLRLEKIVIQTLGQDEMQGIGERESDADQEKRESSKEYFRLWLSDGEFMIQAVLEQPLHDIFLTEDPAVGSVLDVKRFRVRIGKRIYDAGEVVYLAIANYETVYSPNPTTLIQADDFANEGGFLHEEPQLLETKEYRITSPLPKSSLRPPGILSVLSSQDLDSFETAKVDPEVLHRRRQALHALQGSSESAASSTRSPEQIARKRQRLSEENVASPTTLPASHDGVAGSEYLNAGTVADATMPRSGPAEPTLDEALAIQQSTGPAQPLSMPAGAIETTNLTQATAPLHTLSSLFQPSPRVLPSRNYSCSIFAVISWCSPNLIYARHAQSPFPPKRHIKIHDPSIADRYAGVTVAVYDDAGTFGPRIGTVALFRGVVMQKWKGEVILNAYARRGCGDGEGEDQHGGRGWYVDSEERLIGMGYDVEGMKEWWAQKSQGKGLRRVDKKETV